MLVFSITVHYFIVVIHTFFHVRFNLNVTSRINRGQPNGDVVVLGFLRSHKSEV